MKYDRSFITKRAHNFKKKFSLSFSQAMKASWFIAKTGVTKFTAVRFIKASNGDIVTRIGRIVKNAFGKAFFIDYTKGGAFSSYFPANLLKKVTFINPLWFEPKPQETKVVQLKQAA